MKFEPIEERGRCHLLSKMYIMQDIFTHVLPYVDYTINIERVKDGKVEDNYVPYIISHLLNE